jgi:hypothetical protein
MLDDPLAFTSTLFDIHRQELRGQTFHDSTFSAEKMGMARVMAVFSHAIPEGSVASRKALNQTLLHQQIKDAIKGDFVDGHLPSDSSHNLYRCKGPMLPAY